jgi:hypothetical protein
MDSFTMGKDIKMIEQLQTKFQHILYNDKYHQYFTKEGAELTSVTRFLSSLKPKFNSTFWSTIKAYEFSGHTVKSSWNNFQTFKWYLPDLEYGAEYKEVSIYDDHSHLPVTPDDVLAQWNVDSDVGKTRGTYIHNYLEDRENRVTDVPEIIIPEGMSIGQSINYVNSLKTAKLLCDEFVAYAHNHLILVAAEFSIGDERLGLAGRFDRLYFNKETEKYEIWDFKTDKQIRYKSSFGKLKLFDLPDCEFEKYSLQTSLYKKIIEDALGVELGESKIVWFNLKENKWEIIQTKNYVSLINSIDNENWTAYL